MSAAPRRSRRRGFCARSPIRMRATPGGRPGSSLSAASTETGQARRRAGGAPAHEQRESIMYRVVTLTAATLLCALAALTQVGAAELKVLSPGSTEGAFSGLIPQFEKASGHTIAITYGPVGALAARVGKGEAVDVAILSEPATEDLRKSGKLVAGSEV